MLCKDVGIQKAYLRAFDRRVLIERPQTFNKFIRGYR
jgi:hypothetical protein